MRISSSTRSAAGALGAALLFAACSGGSNLSTTGLPQSGPATNSGHAISVSLSRDAGTAGKRLFVSDLTTSQVYIYKMPKLALVGTVTGFEEPAGMCADKAGNVWVADSKAKTVVELSHEGAVENTIVDQNGVPYSCAVNRKNGDLAVTNYIGLSDGPGNVMIYPHASGTPQVLSNSYAQTFYYAGYDPHGNLFVDGESQSFTYMLSECRINHTQCTTLNFSGVNRPGFVQWYKLGGYLAVGDEDCGGSASCVRWVSISGSSASVVGTTNLTNYAGDAVCTLSQSVIEAVRGQMSIVGGDQENGCNSSSSSLGLWSYPSGGAPSHDSTNITKPWGAAISNG